MRAVAFAVAILVPALAATAEAAPKNPPKAAAPTVGIFDLYGGLVGEVATEATLKETRQGATVTSAVLDVCYALSPTTNRRDRFVVNLAPAGGKLNGTGQTQIGKEPVSVQLVRKPTGKTFAFEGTIKVGAVENKVSSTDNTDVSEKQYRENHPENEVVFPSPPAFTEQAPGTIGARVKLEALGELAKALKGEKARVRLDTLQPDCEALRGGSQAVQIDVDPMRAAALVTKLRSMPGVVLAGWTSGSYGIESAIRLSAADYGGANLDRDKLGSALAAAAAKALSATVHASAWNDVTGELSIKLKRPSQSFAGLGLTDQIELVFQPGPEKPGAADTLAVWLGVTTIETYDEGPEPRMNLAQIPQGEGSPGGDYVDTAPLLAALARELKGRIWDADAKAWK